MGGWDDVFESSHSNSNHFNHHKPSVVEVDHDTMMMVNHTPTTNQNNTTKKPTVTIKKKTNTNNSAKTNTSSSSASSPLLQPPSPSMSASPSSESDSSSSSIKQGKRKNLRTTKSKITSELTSKEPKETQTKKDRVDPLFTNIPSSDDDQEVPTAPNSNMSIGWRSRKRYKCNIRKCI